MRPPDVVILDLGLPDIDGGDLLKMLRAVSSVPLIVGTARDDEREIVRLLDAGADDYIVKPFSAAQVDARIRALLRRTSTDEQAPVEAGELVIDPASAHGRARGPAARVESQGVRRAALPRASTWTRRHEARVATEIWGQPFGGTEKTVDTHLSWLRSKLGETRARRATCTRCEVSASSSSRSPDGAAMRRQLVLMTLAVTSIVVIAFVLPLGFLVRTIAADRAVSQANADAQYVGQLIAGNRRAAPDLVAQADASSAAASRCTTPDGAVVGDRARPPDADSLRSLDGPLVQSVVVGRSRRVPAGAGRGRRDRGRARLRREP